jgi:hypothetical protein
MFICVKAGGSTIRKVGIALKGIKTPDSKDGNFRR